MTLAFFIGRRAFQLRNSRPALCDGSSNAMVTPAILPMSVDDVDLRVPVPADRRLGCGMQNRRFGREAVVCSHRLLYA